MAAVTWTFRVIVVVRAVDAASINSQIVSQFNNDNNESHTFETVKLSTTGIAPVQAYACSTAAKPGYKSFLQNLVSSFPQTKVYAMDADNELLVATNSTTAQGSIGQPWKFSNVLNDLGLLVI